MERLPRFLYLHVPKTGGVSFRRVLEDAFAAGETLHVTHTARFAAATPELAPYRFIHGHFTLDEVAHLDGFVRMITLRDPVARCVSAYDFWRGQDPSASQWSAISRMQIAAAHALPLEALCEHPNPQISASFNDHQTRMLSGERDHHAPMTAEHLRRALARLAEIEFVALTEDLDLATLLLCFRFGLYPPRTPARLNVSRERTVVTPELRRALEAHNPMDRRLIDDLAARGSVRLAGLDEAALPSGGDR